MIYEKSEDRDCENDQHAAEGPIHFQSLFCGDNIDPLTVRSGEALFSVDPLVQRGETFPVGGVLFSCIQRREHLPTSGRGSVVGEGAVIF